MCLFPPKTLLFGDFTQDEIALLFTEKQKGFEVG